MNSEITAQSIIDLFGLIYRNLIRDKDDSITINTSSQSALLSVLLRNGPTKMSEIGGVLKVTKPNITFLVDKMEESGLIEREKDLNDRRIINICLTQKGRIQIENKKAELLQKVIVKLSELSDQDYQKLSESVSIISDIIKSINGDDEELLF